MTVARPVPDRPEQAIRDRLARTVRDEAAKVLAVLHRDTGDFDLAEEAVQDALVRALATWPRDGIPQRPGAWLTTVARRRAVDLARRDGRHGQAVAGLAATAEAPDSTRGSTGADDRLAMLFMCCHPALAVEARLALSLRAVVGLSTSTIARAFLVDEATLAQRIVRAKRKIAATGITLTVPDRDLPARLDDVLTVICLTYNAGFLDAQDTTAAPGDLTGDALWLAGLVTDALPDQPEAWGLRALLTFQHARRDARFDDSGSLVLLRDQDRRRWDHPSIARADQYLERAATWRRPGRYQLHAAIAGCHASAPTWPDTDWLQILTLYDLLVRHDPSPVVALNRAVALAEYAGPRAGLDAADVLAARLEGYHLFHATRAELLRRLGRPEQARAADARALELAATQVERNILAERLGAHASGPPTPVGGRHTVVP